MKKELYTYSFEKLEVWQLARQLKKEVYLITRGFPKEELYGYTSQMRRAASSITVNLAEGSGRANNTDKAYFTNMAISSALEIIDHLIGVFDLELISEEEYTCMRLDLDQIIKKLNSLYKFQLKDEESLKSKMKNDKL